MGCAVMLGGFFGYMRSARGWLTAGDAAAKAALHLADLARHCWAMAGEECEAAEQAAREFAAQVALDEDEMWAFWAVTPPKEEAEST
jgi:hypothetical protein